MLQQLLLAITLEVGASSPSKIVRGAGALDANNFTAYNVDCHRLPIKKIF